MSRPRWLYRAAVAMGVIAFLLGFFGFFFSAGADPPAKVSLAAHVFNAFHATVQLYIVDFPARDMDSVVVRIAAVLAPIALATVAIYEFWQRLENRFARWSLHRRPARHLFIGAGGRATAIAYSKAMNKESMIIAGLDRVMPQEFEERMGRLSRYYRKNLGGWGDADTWNVTTWTIEGDARDLLALRHANATGASSVWITTGDDATNLAIARRFSMLATLQQSGGVDPHELVEAKAEDGTERAASVQTEPRDESTKWLLVRVSHTRCVRAEHALHEPITIPGYSVEYFNLERLVAREVFAKHAPVLPGRAVQSSRALELARRPHVAIVGDGEFVDALAVYAAMHWILDARPERAVRITLIGPAATKARARILAEHPALQRDPVDRTAVDFEYRSFADLVAIDTDPQELEPTQWVSAQSDCPFDALYLSGSSDLATARMAVRVAALRDAYENASEGAPIVAILKSVPSRNTKVGHVKAHGLVWFNIYKNLFRNRQPYPGALHDHLASVIFHLYQPAPGDGPEADLADDARLAAVKSFVDRATSARGMREWHTKQSDEFKWSDRYSASHAAVKRRLLEVACDDLDLDLDAALAVERWYESLCRLEHRRFVAERMIDGWLRLDPKRLAEQRPFPSLKNYKGDDGQKATLRLNVTLVPFDDLEGGAEEYDGRIVRALPALWDCERRIHAQELKDVLR